MNRDLVLIIAIFAGWIILNKWILPALGIPTCMSGGCCGPSACSTPFEESSPATQERAPDEGCSVSPPIEDEPK